MKDQNLKNYRLNKWIFFIGIFFFCSCGVPPGLVGKWESGMTTVTVRTQPEQGQYQFTKNSVVVKLEIFGNNKVSGSIGSATFENVKIRPRESVKNSYKFVCRRIGKIFENDPLDNKEVRVKLTPIGDNIIDISLQYRTKYFSDLLPMADLKLVKVKDE